MREGDTSDMTLFLLFIFVVLIVIYLCLDSKTVSYKEMRGRMFKKPWWE